MRQKRIIEFNPKFEPILTQIFNEIYKDGYFEYNYKNDKNKWKIISTKVSNKTKCKKLIDDKFILPPTTNRNQSFGLLIKNKNTDIIKEKIGSKVKFIFNRKIF